MPVTQMMSGALREAMARWRTARTTRRAIFLLGICGMTAGAGLLTAGIALAAVGSQPGSLVLSQTSGPLTAHPTWSTTTACPTNFQGSAAITEFSLTGTPGSLISNVIGSVTAPFSGLLDAPVGQLLAAAPISLSASHPGTAEWVVGCYSQVGATGSVSQVQAIFITVTASGTYNTCAALGSGCPAPSTSPSMSPSPTTSPSGSASPSASASASPSASPTDTSSLSPPPTSTVLPSGAPATGAGGASHSGSPNYLLIALGATSMVGSAGAMGLALRRQRGLLANEHRGDSEPGGSSW